MTIVPDPSLKWHTISPALIRFLPLKEVVAALSTACSLLFALVKFRYISTDPITLREKEKNAYTARVYTRGYTKTNALHRAQ